MKYFFLLSIFFFLFISSSCTDDFLPTTTANVTGQQGLPGEDGEDGLSIIWREQWQSGASYSINDACQYNGSAYICISATSGLTPPNSDTQHWSLMVLGANINNPTYLIGQEHSDKQYSPGINNPTFTKSVS